jgi:hypothetical protein
MSTWEISFPPPTPPWSTNKTLHWAKRAILKKDWRGTTCIMARSLRNLPPCNVQVEIPFTTNARRDPHNYTGTVVKSIIDGLVDAGVWPDDTVGYVTVMDPICYKGDEVRIRLTERAEE